MHGINRAAAIALAAIVAISGGPAAAQSAAGAISNSVSRGISGAIGGAVASRLAKPSLEIANGAGPVAAMAADPTRRHIAIRLADGSLRLWDLDRGSQRRIPIQGVGAMAVFPDGATIALAAESAVQLVDSRSGAVVATISTATRPGAIALSPDGATLAAGDAQGRVVVWEVARRTARQTLSLGSAADALALEGDRLVAADAKGQLRLFDLQRGGQIGQAESLGGPAIALSIAGGQAVAIGADGAMKRIDLATGKAAQGPRASRKATQAVTDAQGRLAALGDGEGRIVLVDATTGQTRRTIDGPKTAIQGLMFNPAGTRLISAGADGVLRVWDAESGKALVQLVSTQSGWSAIDLDGRFDGSEGGLADVRWRVDQAAVPLDQLARRYFEPGLLAAYLGDATPDLAATPGAVTAGMPAPPKVEIDLPEPPTKAGEPYTVIVVATDQGGGIGGVRLYHNGKIVDPGAFVQQQEAVKDKTRIRAAAFRITPVGGLNSLRAAASAQWDVEGMSERVELNFPGDPPRATLHVLTIGINKYKDKKLALDYSVPDATAIQNRV
ncbi:MAG: PQQ-binding-like beta-propeller repeat protein, partial [Rhodospirillales bacterium]|nr:PQQ-binding-like beta-propeller repeat protein [Rhodospirillales bacterium]